ncbi:30S ribosomal protein S18 [Streptomyces sp. BK239]|uniref:30S ribosomal protein S18 n=1 Tax=Streptomyces sp. BK239 TaxID=2512155 RepID=UPI00102BC73B|nr:30S ribosomal protein S18 [Streptomyces sp. BK239]RZU21558.1 small subunit ribosomal protein S18 [Streptomyces sp. BK239]
MPRKPDTKTGRKPDRKTGRSPAKDRANPLDRAGVEYIDYKDTDLLRKFLSDRGKIRSRRVTRVTAQQQRRLSRAIKNAREMALLPYGSR